MIPPLMIRNTARGAGIAEQRLHRLLEEEPGKSDRDGAEDEAPTQPLLRRPLHSPGDGAADDRPYDRPPVAPEIDDQGGRRPNMQEDNKRQERRVVLVDRPAQQLGEDDRVPEAADREELGDALEQRQDEGLEK